MFKLCKQLLLVFLMTLLSTTTFSQKEKTDVDVGVQFTSPRALRILDVLKDKSSVVDFCDNFYKFYYRDSDNNNRYIVEETIITDTLEKYDNIYKISPEELRIKLNDDESKETIYVIPKH